MEEMRKAYQIVVENWKEGEHLGDLDSDGKIILK
jgi:hypothetical protein